MRKLKKCEKCDNYTLKDKHCNKKTKLAGYKYIKVRSKKLK